MKALKISKNQLLVIARTARRQVDIETNFKGCQHKAHKMKTDYSRRLNKKIDWD